MAFCFIFCLLFPLPVAHTSLRWLSLGFRRFCVKATGTHRPASSAGSLPEPPLRIEALKELKVCLERQKTDESHFQLVLSPLTLAEEHSMGQRVSHTLCLSGDCTHCPSKIKLISTCRKG